MPHIDLNNDHPGILGLFHYRPETARPLTELGEILLRGHNTLSRGERELIATYVSSGNDCSFCTASHGEMAAHQLDEGRGLVDSVCTDIDKAEVSPKMRSLLRIAGSVRESGNAVTAQHVTEAREAGASDLEIHDTILIAAAFCMYNRYVDGLAAVTPDDPAAYNALANTIIQHGYLSGLPEHKPA